jgi:hypothetical protein
VERQEEEDNDSEDSEEDDLGISCPGFDLNFAVHLETGGTTLDIIR